MIDYSEFVELARELIAESGRSVQLCKLENNTPDPSKPWLGGPSEVVQPTDNLTVIGTFLPTTGNGGGLAANGGSGIGTSFVKDELLAQVNQIVLVAPPDDEPDTFAGGRFANHDVILDNDARYLIKWAEVLRPGNVVTLYVFGVTL